jgi:hypothetical protein
MGVIVDPIVHQAALIKRDLASAEIAYPKHEVAPPYLYTMVQTMVVDIMVPILCVMRYYP